jgi:hypothetical protein
MLEVPYLDEIVMEKSREAARKTAHRNITAFLEARLRCRLAAFGPVLFIRFSGTMGPSGRVEKDR